MATPSNLPATRPPRRNGWTAERQEAFLKALATSGCVSHACRAVGMSRESAYNLYNRESSITFRRAWDDALDCSIRLVEDGMFSRAIEGVARPIFYQGELVGEYRHFDNRLAMFLLRYRRRHRYGDLPPLPPPEDSSDCGDSPPDPDEAIGSLTFHLDDLVDAPEESSAIDSVNFVNLGDECAAGE